MYSCVNSIYANPIIKKNTTPSSSIYISHRKKILHKDNVKCTTMSNPQGVFKNGSYERRLIRLKSKHLFPDYCNAIEVERQQQQSDIVYNVGAPATTPALPPGVTYTYRISVGPIISYYGHRGYRLSYRLSGNAGWAYIRNATGNIIHNPTINMNVQDTLILVEYSTSADYRWNIVYSNGVVIDGGDAIAARMDSITFNPIDHGGVGTYRYKIRNHHSSNNYRGNIIVS